MSFVEKAGTWVADRMLLAVAKGSPDSYSAGVAAGLQYARAHAIAHAVRLQRDHQGAEGQEPKLRLRGGISALDVLVLKLDDRAKAYEKARHG